MDSDGKTLPDLQMILDAINKLDQKIDAKVDELEAKIAAKFEEMRLQMMSIEARTDHLESGVHETLSVGRKSLSISLDVRGDVRVLREEVYSLMNEVRLRKLEPTALA